MQMMNNAGMAYLDTCIIESDAPGIAADDFDIVALTGIDGQVGAVVMNTFGMDTDVEQLQLLRPVARLLVSVADPHEAADRIRRALRWEARAPF